MSTPRILTAREFQLEDGTHDWRVLGAGANAWFVTPSHRAGADLAALALAVAPHGALDIDVRERGVQVRIPYPDGGFTDGHSALAARISAAAQELGLMPDPSAVQDVQLAMDTLDQESVMPFWQTALGYARSEDDLVDPQRRTPPIWFQDQVAPRPLRNRLHLDIARAQEIGAATVEAAPGLGARVAAHGYHATVTDAEGNEADLLPLEPGSDRWDAPGTEDWRLLFAAIAGYPTSSPEGAAALVTAVADLADAAGLPLGIDVRGDLVVVGTAKDAWELDDGYRALAAQVQQVARAAGLVADPSRPGFVQVVIDAVDIPAVRRFWVAALGYQQDPRAGVSDIVDPRGLGMPVVFQDLDATDAARRAQRNRLHVDVFLPDDQARARVDAAMAAGGRVVRHPESPEWWTLADPEGNEVDLTFSVGREEAWQAASG